MTRPSLKLPILILVLIVSTSSMASGLIAMAIAIGDVSLNGMTVARSTNVLVGDHLVTGESSALILHSRGNTLQVSAHSDLKYQGAKVELGFGTIHVQGNELVASGPYSIQAVGSARFRVDRRETQTTVAVLKGKVKINRGKGSFILTNPGEHNFRDDDSLPTVRQPALLRESAAGAAGGATGALVSRWAKDQGMKTGVSKNSPALR